MAGSFLKNWQVVEIVGKKLKKKNWQIVEIVGKKLKKKKKNIWIFEIVENKLKKKILAGCWKLPVGIVEFEKYYIPNNRVLKWWVYCKMIWYNW